MAHPTPLDLPRFPLRLQALRAERGFSQRELGELSRVGQSYVSHLEAGRRTPSLAAAIGLARALSVDLHDLLGVSRPARRS